MQMELSGKYGTLLLSLVLILAVTLFPYHASAYSSVVAYDFQGSQGNRNLEYIGDFLANLLLFVPLGLGVAESLKHSGRHSVPAQWAAAACALLVSVGVEVAQTFMPSRFPSLADVAANTGGAVAGSLAHKWLGPQSALLLRCAIREMERAANALSRPVVWLPTLVAVFLCAGLLQRETSLANWDPNFALFIGNEADGSRPWIGTVRLLEIADRSASTAELLRARRESLPEISPDHMILNLRPGHHGVDGQSSSRSQDSGKGLIETVGPALTTAIMASGQFTIRLGYEAVDHAQFGPARIVSLSADGFRRNFTIGQQGEDLVLRIRSRFAGPNGSEPEFAVAGVFLPAGRHVLAVAYDGRRLSVASTATGNSRVFRLSPGSVVFRQLGIMKVDEIFGHQVLFLAIAVLPASMLGARMLASQRHRAKSFRLAVVVFFALVPSLCLETWLALVSHSELDLVNILAGVACSMLTLGIVWSLLRSRESCAKSAQPA